MPPEPGSAAIAALLALATLLLALPAGPGEPPAVSSDELNEIAAHASLA